MTEESRPRPGKRELTYREGWKKRKLEVGENGQVTATEETVVFMEQSLWLRITERLFWRRMPGIPAAALPYTLLALPVASFGLIWWLVSLLAQNG